MAKKEETKKNKKNGNKVKKESYFVSLKNELSKVKWPSKQEIFKYTVSTVVFVAALVLFFILLSVLMSAIKGAFN